MRRTVLALSLISGGALAAAPDPAALMQGWASRLPR